MILLFAVLVNLAISGRRRVGPAVARVRLLLT